MFRFQVAFPQRYPDIPPLILFTSDVFHPLVTPLTTFTYTTGSSSTDTVSATDEERLLPGGLSLRHGFSRWFERGTFMSPTTPVFQDPKESIGGQEEHRASPTQETKDDRPPVPPKSAKPFHIPPPKEDGFSSDGISPSIIEVLLYLKRVFEDESLLDDLPLDAAGNPGAWHAWRAHRRRTRPVKALVDDIETQTTSSRRGLDSAGKSKPSGNWNWDGVWAERVKRGVNGSLSESMLYGGSDGDDLVVFLLDFYKQILMFLDPFP